MGSFEERPRPFGKGLLEKLPRASPTMELESVQECKQNSEIETESASTT